MEATSPQASRGRAPASGRGAREGADGRGLGVAAGSRLGELRNVTISVSPGDEAYGAVRGAILSGRLEPGVRIVEQQLADMLAVSRTPVREALLKLEQDNLIVRVGRGMAVRTFGCDELRDIYDLRAHLESYAAHEATERITDAYLHALERGQDELEAVLDGPAEDPEARRSPGELDQRFHMALVRSARSAPLERCLTQALQLPLLYTPFPWYDADDLRRSVAEHRELIELVRARDADGAEAHWRAHVERDRDVLIEHMVSLEMGEPAAATAGRRSSG